MSAEAERLKRLLAPTARMLVRRADGQWAVIAGGDRRRRPVLVVDGGLVETLLAAGDLLQVSEGVLVLAPGAAPPIEDAPAPPPWVFFAQGAARPGRRAGGRGFAGWAMLSREGRGPLSLRQTQAGLRLIADAERAAADQRLTMNWDAGPTTRKRMSGTAGGRAGDALAAAKQLLRLRQKLGNTTWRLLWSLCVDADPMSAIGRRFALTHRTLKVEIADALEKLAAAYDGNASVAWARMR